MREDTVTQIAAAIIAADQTPWQALAACAAQPGAMDHVDTPAVWDALRTCEGCPVRVECEQWVEGERDYIGVAAGKVYRSPRSRGKTLRLPNAS